MATYTPDTAIVVNKVPRNVKGKSKRKRETIPIIDGSENKTLAVIDKAVLKDLYDSIVTPQMKSLAATELVLAKGAYVVIKMIFRKQGNKRIPVNAQLVKDEDEILQAMIEYVGLVEPEITDEGYQFYVVKKEQPNIVALKDLLDRTMGKPVQPIDAKVNVTTWKDVLEEWKRNKNN
jgi:hypothetical protein